MTGAVTVRIPDSLKHVFSGKARYRGAHGGRGSAKSMTFAKMLAILGATAPHRILCAREIQKTIQESSKAEIEAAIESEEWLADMYEIGKSFIRCTATGSEFLFMGLRHNAKEIKSTRGITICWVEEAEAVSEQSWRVLIPTIRAPGSEIWLTWNPEAEDSATNKRFILNPPPRSKIAQINYKGNPWFPPELEEERKADLARDPDMYRHIWLGETITRTDAQVFNKRWRVEAFDDSLADKADRIYMGADFGFAQDPSTLIRFFVLSNKLFIQHEAYGHEVEIDEMPEFYDSVPGARKWPIKGDCSRPETISYLRRKGFQIAGAEKWPGCIEDGITHLKGYDEIIIHERCEETAREFGKYSYKIDRVTEDVLPIVLDRWNHCIDAIRYGHDGIIQKRGAAGVWARLAG